MPTTIEPKPRIKPTRITLDHPVIIGNAIEDIMKVCGGDSFGFGYAYRPTSKGEVPLFSVYSTTKGKDYNTSRTIYNIDPMVVCTEYCHTESS
jgi:hypothetical protein